MKSTRLFWLLPMLATVALAETRGVQVTIRDRAGTPVALYEESYALVIGVSDYTAGWPPLRGVKQDVVEVKAALERQGFSVTVVMDPDRRGLEDAFQDFITKYGQKADNRLLFYFAGHGHTMRLAYGGQMGYLVPRDAPNPNHDSAGFLRKALSMQAIEVFARNIQSKHALFVFDSCFSGAIFNATRAIPDNIAEKTGKPVRQFITSGAADQQVPDKSVFRDQFVAALDGEADMDHDGYVTGTELGQFLENKVTNYSRRAQTPQYGKLPDPLLDKGDFVFALPRRVESPSAAPSPTQTPAQGPDPRALELAFWESIKSSTTPGPYEEYLKQFPNGTFAGLAKLKIDEMRRPASTPIKAEPVPAPAVATPSPAPLWKPQEKPAPLPKPEEKPVSPQPLPATSQPKTSPEVAANTTQPKFVNLNLAKIAGVEHTPIVTKKADRVPSPPPKPVKLRYSFGSPKLIEGDGDVSRVAFSRDGSLAAAEFGDKHIRVWQTDPFVQLWEIETFRMKTHALSAADSSVLSFSADNRMLAFVSEGALHILDLTTGKFPVVLLNQFFDGFFHPTNPDILFLRTSNEIGVYNRGTKQFTFSMKFDSRDDFHRGFTSLTEQYGYFGLYYSTEMARCSFATNRCESAKIAIPEGADFSSFAVSQDDSRLALVIDFNEVRVFSVSGWPWTLKRIASFRHANTVADLKFLDPDRILTGSVDRSAAIWNAKTGGRLSTFAKPGKLSYVGAVAASPAVGKILIGALYGVLYLTTY